MKFKFENEFSDISDDVIVRTYSNGDFRAVLRISRSNIVEGIGFGRKEETIYNYYEKVKNKEG